MLSLGNDHEASTVYEIIRKNENEKEKIGKRTERTQNGAKIEKVTKK
jgi:hypothetical protein